MKIIAIELEQLSALHEEDELYAGASVINASNSEIEGIYATKNTTNNRGHFVTRKLISQNIKEVWQDIVLKYEGGSFVVKQRKEPKSPTESEVFNGTWTANNKFTCTDASFDTATTAGNIKEGDEVIVRKGQGSGLLAHITDIPGTAVTIDEEMAFTSGTFTFSCERWNKINTSNKDIFSLKANLKDPMLESQQFKVEMRDTTLEEIQVESIPATTIKKS